MGNRSFIVCDLFRLLNLIPFGSASSETKFYGRFLMSLSFKLVIFILRKTVMTELFTAALKKQKDLISSPKTLHLETVLLLTIFY